MALNGSKATASRFTPGSGLIPPYLAGREYEQAVLSEQHAIVAAGESAPADVVLVGPRGNGKTALLRWFENTITERGAADVVWVTPTRIPSVGAKETGAGLAERQGLNAPGFIWQSLDPAYKAAHGTLNVFEPGIPSLMAHVRDEAARNAG